MSIVGKRGPKINGIETENPSSSENQKILIFVWKRESHGAKNRDSQDPLRYSSHDIVESIPTWQIQNFKNLRRSGKKIRGMT